MDNIVKFKIAFPVLLIVAGLIIVRQIDFKLVLTPSERRVVDFVPEAKVLFQEKKKLPVGHEKLESPIYISPVAAKELPPVQVEQVVPQQAAPQVIPSQQVEPKEEETRPEFKVTMIVIGDKSKMAIVNGAIVREGTVVDEMVVKKIEKERVLLTERNRKNGKAGTMWFSLEGTKK